MKMYKGFNKDLQCTPDGKVFQYEVGKTYEETDADLCRSGFHACEAPLDVFGYYSPSDSRYCEVDLEDVSDERDSDTKRVGKKITIGAEIDIPGLVKAHVEWVKAQCKEDEATGGDRSALTGGDRSALTGGDRSALTGGHWSALTGGDRSALTGGDRSALTGGQCSVLRGGESAKFRGGIWTVFVASEWEGGRLKRLNVAIVDGLSIKENTWYTVRDGEFVEVRE